MIFRVLLHCSNDHVILGSFACANADTWASEFGTVLTSKDPWLITSGKRVPKGISYSFFFVQTIFQLFL